MKLFIIRFLSISFVLFAFTYNLVAQDCTGKLQQAQQLFDAGQIEQIPSLLDSCIQIGFSTEDKQKAYRLLIQVNLFDYNRDNADSLMLKFLSNYPEYKIQSTDPSEFSELFNLYKVHKTWGLGVSLGYNLPQISVSEHFSVASLNKINSTYSPIVGNFTAGVLINRYIGSHLWISSDIKYSVLNLKNIETLSVYKEVITYKEKTKWLNIPVMLNYSFGNKQISPFIFCGGELGYLLSASSEIKRSIVYDNIYPEIVQPLTNISNTREKINIWGVGGVGANFNVRGGYFSVRAGYNYNFSSYVKPEYRYFGISKIQYHNYIDDNFVINNMFFNISYSRLFYRIKKSVVNDTSN